MIDKKLTTREFLELLKPPYLSPIPIPRPVRVTDGSEEYFDGLDAVVTKYPPKSSPIIRGLAVDATPDGEHKNESGDNE